MRTSLLLALLAFCWLVVWPSPLQAQNSLILSKDAGGSFLRNRLSFTLRTIRLAIRRRRCCPMALN
jgi:hypothetical protein